jgi:putative ABC transport system permease protein
MIKFLLKGILGDKNRSILPIIIITIGVSLTILLSGYMRGVMGDMIDQNARFDTGHMKIMSRAYAENIAQLPNDLALLGVDELKEELQKDYPEIKWIDRIKFGGLIDVPNGENASKGQGPAAGMAMDIFNPESGEDARMNLTSSIVKGKLPSQHREALVGNDFAEKLNIEIGDEVTYMGTTMNGAMTFENFVVSGTIKFGMPAMDKGAIVIDISDARQLLDMEDGVGEMLGFLPGGVYDDEEVAPIVSSFNAKYAEDTDEYAPEMLALRDQNGLSSYLDMVDYFAALFVGIFVFAMSMVLWNTGLLGGLRRYQEFGIRLALGEPKGHIYRTLIYEAVLIGIIGSVVGTTIGLFGVYLLQKYGIDIGDLMKDSSMMMPTVLRGKMTPDLLYIGFIPGLFAMVLGNMLSGIGIYRRSTASLFKELEV